MAFLEPVTLRGEYARLAGYPEAVSAAIEEQYLPDSAGGPLPQTEAGKVLAAADKLDTLATSFSLGHKPSGSRDPYGLRRAAIGLNRLAVEFRTHFFNHQSRRGIERLGAKQDGILRNHQIAPNGTLRDTVVYSIIAGEWPTVKAHLNYQLNDRLR